VGSLGRCRSGPIEKARAESASRLLLTGCFLTLRSWPGAARRPFGKKSRQQICLGIVSHACSHAHEYRLGSPRWWSAENALSHPLKLEVPPRYSSALTSFAPQVMCVLLTRYASAAIQSLQQRLHCSLSSESIVGTGGAQWFRTHWHSHTLARYGSMQRPTMPTPLGMVRHCPSDNGAGTLGDKCPLFCVRDACRCWRGRCGGGELRSFPAPRPADGRGIVNYLALVPFFDSSFKNLMRSRAMRRHVLS